jgi:hypothetical protein
MALTRRSFGANLFRSLVTGCLLFGVVGACLAADYFVSPSGNDSNDGLSAGSQWKTVTNINTHDFNPGDSIRFAAGQTFFGGLIFNAQDQGGSNSPILLTSYGSGRATLNAGTNIAIAATNVSYFVVSNLNFVGAGNLNTNDGIRFICDLPGNVLLPSLVIDGVEVSQFGASGINIGGWQGRSGFRDVSILNSSSHHNIRSGISIFAFTPESNENVHITRCQTYENRGDAVLAGSGIVVGGVKHALVELCVSYENGKFSQIQGPVGIWAYDSADVTLQLNESHHNHSITGYDGGGFDFDINTRHSVMQYNYSHDNDGPGLLQCCGTTTSNNIIRYNVSDNDSHLDWAGGITLYGNVIDAQIYNNTVYYNQTSAFTGALMIFSATTNLRLRNNIIWVEGGGKIAWIQSGQNNLQLQGNDYWSGNPPFLVTDSGVDFSSFSAWRSATGREHLNGSAVGFNVDPKLTGPGNATTLNDAALLGTLAGYKLRPESPLINAGLNLSAFNQVPGPRDFYGSNIPMGNSFDIGAHEFVIGSLWRIQSPQWLSNSFSFTAFGPVGYDERY